MSTLKINRLEKKTQDLVAIQERMLIIHELELEQLNRHWAEKFSLIVDMMQAQINQDIEIAEDVFRPQTLSEFKRWFREWTEDINAIDAGSEDAGEQMADVIVKHGFKFIKRNPPIDMTHKEILDASKAKGKRHGKAICN